MFLSSIEEPLSSESFDDGITCQFSRVLENNAASFSLQTIDLLLVLMTTAMPGDIYIDLYKRLADSVVNRRLTLERIPSFWDTLDAT